jgi:UDP-N-acetylglucosamine 2-epimerase (non-hydrolysing)
MTAVIFGTRPEIIKLSPVIRALQKRKRPYFVIHTGQHYSYEMDRVFIEQLELPQPRYILKGRSKGQHLHGEHTGRLMADIEAVLLQEKPKIVLVEGDTNTVLAGSLVSAKANGIRLGHVEAGLRSYDRQMPEEINRIVSDHLSDLLFAPTAHAKKILLGEGIPAKKIFVTGNTIVDSVRQNLEIADRKINLAKALPPLPKEYFLMTLHRQENVDDKKRLGSILQALEKVGNYFKKTIVFPVHPRTLKMLGSFGMKMPGCVLEILPVGFLEFLKLERGAGLLLTDSGGVQEEGCILKIPCVTLRTSTERPETVQVGANVVAGTDPGHVLACAKKMIGRKRNWPNPFGDGRSGERIAQITEKLC